MKTFVVLAFIAALVFGYALVGPGKGTESVGGAIGVGIALTLIGWLVARKAGAREGVLVMTALAVFAWIGR